MTRIQKSKDRKALFVSIGVILLAVIGGLLAVWLVPAESDPPAWEGFSVPIDPACRPGPLEGMSDDHTPMEDGTVRYRMNRAVWFPSAKQEGTVLFQSDSGNVNLVRLCLRVDGEPVYESGFIAPGSHISGAELSRPLSAGSHEGFLEISLYSSEGTPLSGSLSEPITVTIEE